MRNAAQRSSHAIAGQILLADPDTQIRCATAADDRFCRALFHEQRAEQFAPLGLGDEMLRRLLDQQYHAQSTNYARQFPDAAALIVEHVGSDVGRLIVALRRRPSEPADSGAQLPPDGTDLHLVDIIIAASARNRGIGGDVVAGLARAGHAIGATQFSLLVLQTNLAAQRLYQRLGFAKAADRGVYIEMVRPLV